MAVHNVPLHQALLNRKLSSFTQEVSVTLCESVSACMRACVHVCVKCACAFVPVQFALHDLIICCQILLDFTSNVLNNVSISFYN